MPVSDKLQTDQARLGATAKLAVIAEVLYLLNLLLLPGLAFIILLLLNSKKKNSAGSIALSHMKQAIVTSLWAVVLLLVINGLILLLGGYQGPYVWMFVIIYFTLGHSSFILLGVVGLIKALNSEYWRYPLVGSPPVVRN